MIRPTRTTGRQVSRSAGCVGNVCRLLSQRACLARPPREYILKGCDVLRRSRLLAECFAVSVLITMCGAALALASQTCTVQKGDTYWSLARKFSVSPYALAYANKALGNKPLQIGQKITVPAKGFKVPAHKAQVTASTACVRGGAAIGARKIGAVGAGERVYVAAMAHGWCKVKTASGLSGWVSGDFLSPSLSPVVAKKVQVASHQRRAGGQRRYASYNRYRAPAPQASCDAGEVSDDVVRTALAYRGSRYRYGGTSRGGFDCSGFTSHVYAKHGVRLPHSSRAQAGVGQRVSRDELKEGDLVLFHTTRRGVSHVGIYAGNGKFVHASSHGRGVRVDNLNAGYYSRRLVGARRVK